MRLTKKNKVVKIESISPKKRNNELFILKLSNDTIYEISKNVLVKTALKEGEQIEKSVLDEVLQKQEQSNIQKSAI